LTNPVYFLEKTFVGIYGMLPPTYSLQHEFLSLRPRGALMNEKITRIYVMEDKLGYVISYEDGQHYVSKFALGILVWKLTGSEVHVYYDGREWEK